LRADRYVELVEMLLAATLLAVDAETASIRPIGWAID
jgi:hypothetical protein